MHRARRPIAMSPNPLPQCVCKYSRASSITPLPSPPRSPAGPRPLVSPPTHTPPAPADLERPATTPSSRPQANSNYTSVDSDDELLRTPVPISKRDLLSASPSPLAAPVRVESDIEILSTPEVGRRRGRAGRRSEPSTSQKKSERSAAPSDGDAGRPQRGGGPASKRRRGASAATPTPLLSEEWALDEETIQHEKRRVHGERSRNVPRTRNRGEHRTSQTTSDQDKTASMYPTTRPAAWFWPLHAVSPRPGNAFGLHR